MDTCEIILASASPRRRKLFESLGIRFRIDPARIGEEPLPGETAADLVRRLARAKAEEVGARNPAAWVIGADTVVVLGGRILGKPSGASDAFRMLHSLAGTVHEVLTGVAVVNVRAGLCRTELDRSLVRMRHLSADEIRQYVASGEPMGKAGGYAIQGSGGRFVKVVSGSRSNVIGLPLDLLRRLLGAVAGLRLPSRPPRPTRLGLLACIGLAVSAACRGSWSSAVAPVEEPRAPARWVLEMEAGWFEPNRIRPGDRLELSPAIREVVPR